MSDYSDIRWIQRLENFNRAFNRLDESAEFIADYNEMERPVNEVQDDLMRQGLIQNFEFTHELASNVMKDYAHYQGNATIRGSRDAKRAAFEMGLIEDGEVWMEMLKSRNETSHTYDEATAHKIFTNILTKYTTAFRDFQQKMAQIKSDATQNGTY
jgi:nucleotidyltransferase substrate binding protein (TIGR01987 family)